MNRMNELLSMVENPTRRRILEVLAIAPHYALQLSRELGISQPAIVKHLDQMERIGIVRSYQEDSRIGPKKTLYVPNSEFTLMVDMRSGMFTIRLAHPSNDVIEEEDAQDVEDARTSIQEIDQKIRELEEMRSKLIRRRESLMSAMIGSVSDTMYGHRSLLYELLNAPGKDLNELTMDLSMNLEIAKEMLEDIENMIKGGKL